MTNFAPKPSLPSSPPGKRMFDLTVTACALPLWGGLLAAAAVTLSALGGPGPLFYRSVRQTGVDATSTLAKFRTMVPDAVLQASPDQNRGRAKIFLNVPIDSALYTPAGRLIERLALTELPELFHVLSGELSLVGSRPLPAEIAKRLEAAYPGASARFAPRCGMVGPVQLVGREALSDFERLDIETTYARIAANAWTWRLDFELLWLVLAAAVRRGPYLSYEAVMAWLHRHDPAATGRAFEVS